MTIAFAVAISAFNARDADAGARRRCCCGTSTSARACSSASVERVIHARHEAATSASCARTDARSAGRMVVVFLALLGCDLLSSTRGCRSRSCRKRIQGYFIAVVQAPAGASLRFTVERREGGRGRS